jgi:hypothetical protein
MIRYPVWTEVPCYCKHVSSGIDRGLPNNTGYQGNSNISGNYIRQIFILTHNVYFIEKLLTAGRPLQQCKLLYYKESITIFQALSYVSVRAKKNLSSKKITIRCKIHMHHCGMSLKNLILRYRC